VSTARLREACASLDADVLALQEIDRGQRRSHGADQTAEVADAMGAAAGNWKFVPAIVGEPGAAWRAATDDEGDTEEPGYGVGLVSRLPVKAWHVLRLPAAPVKSPVVVPGGRGEGARGAGVILLPDEPRVAVAADLGALVVATTHLSFVPGWNLRQLRRVVAWLGRLGPSCILIGDLNVPGPLPRWVTGWRPLATVKTFPAGNPRLQVDHALASGPTPPVIGAEARKLSVADHCALVLQLGSEQWQYEP
jgi:endonuclease/exonuclease/phosphatase family metal-dependent hydrolase